MKTSAEMRREARESLKGGWFMRLFLVIVVFQAILQFVMSGLGWLNVRYNVITLGEYIQRKAEALQQGMDYTLPNALAYRHMYEASAFNLFLCAVFCGIMAFGVAVLLLRLLERRNERWFADSFGGFRRPLSNTWLVLVMNVIVGLLTLLFIVPGVVFAYRYRLAWYLKAEHPDWGAFKCLGESARMMKGYKWRALSLDLSYTGWWLLAFVLGEVAFSLSAFGHDVACGLVQSLALLAFFYTLIYFLAGRAVFYREVKALQPVAESKAEDEG